MPLPSFAFAPNTDAVALISGLRPVASSVFYELLPELRARAFTVSGVEGANVLQRVRDAIAALPQGLGPDGKDYTWDTQAKEIAAELEPFLGEEGAASRAEILLRTSGFQAFSSTIWNISQADDDTTHLQYIHGDQAKDPTPSHLALDGIVLPKDDPFWETHTGPWGHLGCVCYVRPMNEDLVAEEQSKDDQQANPEARNVLDGETLNQLHNGTLMRAGRRHDVSPPEGERAFKWHPDDLRIPMDSLKPRYDPPVWDAFHLWSMKTMVGEGTTVWQWLEGKDPTPTPAQRQRIARATKHILDHKLPTISPIRPISPIPPIPSPKKQGLAAIPPVGPGKRTPPETVGSDDQLAGMNQRARAKVLAHEAEIVKLPFERALVLDENGKVLFPVDGDVSKIDFTPDQQRAMRGRVVTHNHPGGGTFSLRDIFSACTFGVQELRAVSSQNTFSLRAGSRKLDPRNYQNIRKAISRLSPRNPTPEQFHEVLKTVAAENGLIYVVT